MLLRDEGKHLRLHLHRLPGDDLCRRRRRRRRLLYLLGYPSPQSVIDQCPVQRAGRDARSAEDARLLESQRT